MSSWSHTYDYDFTNIDEDYSFLSEFDDQDDSFDYDFAEDFDWGWDDDWNFEDDWLDDDWNFEDSQDDMFDFLGGESFYEFDNDDNAHLDFSDYDRPIDDSFDSFATKENPSGSINKLISGIASLFSKESVKTDRREPSRPVNRLNRNKKENIATDEDNDIVVPTPLRRREKADKKLSVLFAIGSAFIGYLMLKK